jgi:hypothetical protein
MTKKTFAVLVAVLTFIVGVAIARLSLPSLRPTPAGPVKEELKLSNYLLSGPFQHENLTIFLIHAPDQPDSRMFTPLQEAMDRKLVIVHETSDVNDLAIENVSTSEEVFVQAGDIVKGGQQDRVLAVDMILPAKSGKMPIAAFCVEHSRWSQRAGEPIDQFSMSSEMVATKELKLAARHATSQRQVWDGVAQAQQKLSNGLSVDVQAARSRSSLQLALENEKVQEATATFTKKLSSVIDGESDAIGFVFAINNKLNSADVYSSNALFKRFWPRLLKTAAIEAVAERASNEKNEPVSIAATGEFLVSSEKGAQSKNEITPRTLMLKRDAEKSVFFETRDMEHGAAWIHRSYLTK